MDTYRGMLFKSEYKDSNLKKSFKWTSTLLFLGLALITRILLFFAAKNPFLVERLYSSSIYPYIAKGIGFISNLIPFSIAEIFLILIVFVILIGLITFIIK